MANRNITKSVKCSFCGKPQEMVKRIVAGPNAYICDECIAICNNIIEDENYDEETGYEDLKSEDIPTPAEIKQILDEYSQTDDLGIPWTRLHTLWGQLQNHSHDPESITPEEQFEYISILNQIRNRVDCLIDQYGMTTDFSAIKQWLRNMDRNFFDFSSRLKYRVFGGLLGSMRVQIRDNAMAENVLWYKKHFPDEKLIIWCANLHAAKDVSQIMDCALNDYYHNLLTENLYHELGNEVYSIAITSLNRSDLQQPGELEQQIAHFTSDAPYAFINCERLRWLDGYRTAVFEFPEVGKRKNGHWLNIFDGIYYIRDIECMQLNNKTEEPENLQTE